jgi:hypothetical protein
MISADNTLHRGNFGAHCLLLFDGDLKPRVLDEILSSHTGQRVQSAVFLCAAWGKLKQFHHVPSKEILSCFEETVQTPTILLQKVTGKLEQFLCFRTNCVRNLFRKNG